MKPKGYRFLKIAGLVLLFFAVVIHLLAYNIRGKESLNFAERSVLFVAWPLQAMADSLLKKAGALWDGYVYLVGTGKQNMVLDKENKALKASLVKTEELRLENERLTKLLDFTKAGSEQYAAARVLSNGPSNLYHTIVIDKGDKDGLKRGMAVISAEGVVGQVSHVTGSRASVISLLDPSGAIDAMDQVTRARGLLVGYRANRLAFKYLPFSEEVKVGEKVLSTGLDGIFPKGLMVGEIRSVEKRKEDLFQEVYVDPAVDFSKLEEVLVRVGPTTRQEPSPK